MSGHKTAVSPKRMKEDFELIKQKIRIEDIANYLLGEDVRGMYKFPQERTASIKIYPKTQSFFDYGRGTGGDAIRLWAYIRQVDNWTALKKIKVLYGLENELDKGNIKQRIRQQERDREAAKQVENKRKAAWRGEVDFWKKISAACENVIKQSEVLSDNWCWAINQRQFSEYQLDILCGVL